LATNDITYEQQEEDDDELMERYLKKTAKLEQVKANSEAFDAEITEVFESDSNDKMVAFCEKIFQTEYNLDFEKYTSDFNKEPFIATIVNEVMQL